MTGRHRLPERRPVGFSDRQGVVGAGVVGAVMASLIAAGYAVPTPASVARTPRALAPVEQPATGPGDELAVPPPARPTLVAARVRPVADSVTLPRVRDLVRATSRVEVVTVSAPRQARPEPTRPGPRPTNPPAEPPAGESDPDPGPDAEPDEPTTQPTPKPRPRVRELVRRAFERAREQRADRPPRRDRNEPRGESSSQSSERESSESSSAGEDGTDE